ncbi:MAG: hypothetical protein ACREX6_04115 [Casimicrobiaceae bacterium]
MTLELIDRLRVRSPFRLGPTLMHPECPIEQAVTSANFQVREALLREIWRRTPAHEYGTLLIAHPDRLRVLARTEALLRPAIDALADRYQREVDIHPPQVRYALGPPVLEPYMTLLLSGTIASLSQVQRDLNRRRAHVARIDHDDGRFTLEAEAPLAALLGYADWLEKSTFGEVDSNLWLSRYLPIDDQGPAAA